MALSEVCAPAVEYTKCEVNGYHNQIDDVENANIVNLVVQQFSKDSGDVPDDNCDHEYNAFSLRRAGGQAFVHGDGP